MNRELPVLVTGASGFVGKHVASQLLAKGYNVRGTVRSAQKAEMVRQTLARIHGPEVVSRLELFVADLLSDDGWKAAMNGAGAVMHVATLVYEREPKDPQDAIRPAVEGTERVLRFAREAGINRVIMTSSIASIGYGQANAKGTLRIDESSWTDIEGLKGSWAYAEAKTRAERYAWDFAAEHGIGLTTIHPGMILGPALDADAGISIHFVDMCLNGKVPALPPAGFCIVDVRDVAEMHVAALEKDESIGQRYISAGPYTRFLEAARILGENYPKAKVPDTEAPVWIMKIVGLFDRTVRQISADFECARIFDGSKGAALMGHDFRPPEEALVSAAESLIEFGFIDEARVL